MGIPTPVQKVVIEGDVSAIIKDDRSVFSGDGLPPPFVVDAPTFVDGFHASCRLARHTYMNWLPVFIG